MKLLKLVATLMSLAIACLGVLGIVAPALLFEFGHSLLTLSALYWVAGVRIVFGGLLILVAAGSRFPRVLRVFGIVILVAGLTAPLLGTERLQAMFAWLPAQPPPLARAIAVVPLIVGLFFVYAINGQNNQGTRNR